MSSLDLVPSGESWSLEQDPIFKSVPTVSFTVESTVSPKGQLGLSFQNSTVERYFSTKGGVTYSSVLLPDCNQQTLTTEPATTDEPSGALPMAQMAEMGRAFTNKKRNARAKHSRLRGKRATGTDGSFLLLFKAEGRVKSLSEDGSSFEADIIDYAQRDIIQPMELLTSELLPDDQKLLRPGAVFYWYIGYQDSPIGRQRRSIFWLQRRGRMSDEQFEASLAKVNEDWNAIEWGNNYSNTE